MINTAVNQKNVTNGETNAKIKHLDTSNTFIPQDNTYGEVIHKNDCCAINFDKVRMMCQKEMYCDKIFDINKHRTIDSNTGQYGNQLLV